MVLARDACLLTPKIMEIVYNEIFIGLFLQKLGIDSPLNVTSMLGFDSGTKLIVGGILNSTISTVIGAGPNLRIP